MKSILLASFDNYIEAHLVLGRLQQDGIDCWLQDENTVTINPIFSGVVGGIKLMVTSDQYAKALQLQEEFAEELKKTYRCPNCGSSEIAYVAQGKKVKNWISSIVTWLLGSYAIPIEKTWHCYTCSEDFPLPDSTEITSTRAD